MPWTWESKQEIAINAIGAAANYVYLGIAVFMMLALLPEAIVYGVMGAWGREILLAPGLAVLTAFLVIFARRAVRATKAVRTIPRNLKVVIDDSGQITIYDGASYKILSVQDVDFCVRPRAIYSGATVSVGPVRGTPTAATLYDVRVKYPEGEIWMTDILPTKFEELNALLGRLKAPLNLC
ncbi:MAG: hypothetical protein QXP98_07400 [Thermoproteus sp.]